MGKKNDAANFQINTGSDDDSKDGNDSTSLFRFVTVNPKKLNKHNDKKNDDYIDQRSTDTTSPLKKRHFTIEKKLRDY